MTAGPRLASHIALYSALEEQEILDSGRWREKTLGPRAELAKHESVFISALLCSQYNII